LTQKGKSNFTSNVLYRFVTWQIDGVSAADTNNQPFNPVPPLLFNQAHSVVAIYLPQNLDSDTNGLPDWWEYAYFGSTGVSLQADPDQDGQNNWQEYVAGTNPRDPHSAFALNAVLSPASPFQLQWPSVAGKTYNIWRATNLLTGFTLLATNLPATPPLNFFPDSRSSEGSVFYRLEVNCPWG
jgi:hypothetical protein